MKLIGQSDGARADFPRLGTRYILRGEDTGGQFALVEHEIPPRALAAPTHMHAHEDEFERYFEEMAPHLAGAGPPDFEALAALQAKYGLVMDRNSIEPLMKQHGLEA